jgi:molybdopterin molybdotransferase
VLAADVLVSSLLPSQVIALRDGYAVEAAAIADAGVYSPVPFAKPPQRVDVADPLPRGTDSIVPIDAINVRGNSVEAVAAVAPGESALPAGADAAPQTPLRRSGEFMRGIDTAVISSAGVREVRIRVPHVAIALGNESGSPVINAAIETLILAIGRAGGLISNEPAMLDEVLANAKPNAVICVGGTGSGRKDHSVQILARHGRVEAHGIAVSPGETAAFGFVGGRPVLLVPGRLDCALAIWLLIGRHFVARLAGGRVEDPQATLPLQRKVTSTIGMTELVPVRCAGGTAEPLAAGYLPFTALAQSDGWIVAPAESEGFAAGTQVAVRPWP